MTTVTHALNSPFPYFGGKRRIAEQVWARLGEVGNFVEPFFGSGAVLLARPHDEPGIETVNDLDGLLCNFWRAVQADPEQTAQYADWPAHECDLHARHAWLVGRKDGLQARLEGDPAYYDAQAAGWWVWGMAMWIGGGFCSGEGPWRVVDGPDGLPVLATAEGDAGQGVQRRRLHLSDAGNGVQRKRLHLSDAGQGVQRRRLHLGDGKGVQRATMDIASWFAALSARLRLVRVACGDWTRVLGPSVTTCHGLTGVFLDPPYSAEAGRDMELYRQESGDVAHDVRAWCLAHGDDPLFRLVLCGYAGEGHDVLVEHGWSCVAWKASGGYAHLGNGAGKANAHRERLWFSPHCLGAVQARLFE